MLLKDIDPGTHGSSPWQLTEVNGAVFFGAYGPTGPELWKTDGTPEGTTMVRDILPANYSYTATPNNLTNVEGTLFFVAGSDGIHEELWKSDGTYAGTVKVKDIRATHGSAYMQALTNVNGTLFFSGNDGVRGIELWKSDGTPEGTVLVKDIDPGPGSSLPSWLTNVDGMLYFATGRGIWKSDGTEAGTRLIATIQSGLATPPASMNGRFFFAASLAENGPPVLWKSDGTAEGTVVVKDVAPGSFGHQPFGQPLLNVNGTLYFVGEGEGKGKELWKSDGTEAGTVLVKDIVPGAVGSFPGPLVNLNGTLFFPADDEHGREIWRSDGTEAGTVLVADLQPLLIWEYPVGLVAGGPGLYFTAITGNPPAPELWALGVPLITNDDGVALAEAPQAVTYTMTVSNPGPRSMTGAVVSDVVPSGLEGATWTCTATGSAVCAAGGSGSIADTVDLPGGGALTYVTTGTVSSAASGQLSNTGRVTLSGDTASYSATDIDVVGTALGYHTMVPCRLLDTRSAEGLTGGPASLRARETRTFRARDRCAIPESAKSLVLNVTAIGAEAGGHVRLFPASQALPNTLAVGYPAGQIRSSHIALPLDAGGRFAAYVAQPTGTTVDLVVDVSGYFE